MFQDSLLANALLFALGQAAAIGHLRTGRIRRGMALMFVGWVLADVALLARFAFAGGQLVFVGALVLLQIYSAVEAALFAFGRLRRRRAAVRGRAGALYRQALVHYLRNELEPAERICRGLLRADPWDVEAALSLGCVLARSGRPRRARGWLRAARALDTQERYGDLIALELERLGAAVPPAPAAATTPSSAASPAPR